MQLPATATPSMPAITAVILAAVQYPIAIWTNLHLIVHRTNFIVTQMQTVNNKWSFSVKHARLDTIWSWKHTHQAIVILYHTGHVSRQQQQILAQAAAPVIPAHVQIRHGQILVLDIKFK